MARDPDGNNNGTAWADFLWGTARVLGDGSYDNYGDYDSAVWLGALRGYGGNDTIFGDIYYNGNDFTEGDEIYGGDGDDAIWGDCGTDEPGWQTSTNGGSDELYGGAGNDRIYGQAGSDEIWGGTGNDTLIGGIGGDHLRGEAGNDYIITDIAGATATGWYNSAWGGAGNDTIHGGRGIDEAYGDAGDDHLIGNGGGDDLEGGNGADRLWGGDGDDRLEGGGYYATALDLGDSLWGGAGMDTMFGGAGNDSLSGGIGADVLDGGDGNDTLDGGTGADSMACGAGNDVYVVDHALDVLRWDYNDSGTDLVRASVNWTLGAYQENLTLQGTLALRGTGNAGANVISGNSGANVLLGLAGTDILAGAAGNDSLDGGLGNDRLWGGTGNDQLVGGSGADWLNGGAGADRFVFRGPAESRPGAASQDVIQDFVIAQGDRIDLSLIDANVGVAGNQAFAFLGGAAFSGQAGQLRWTPTANGSLVQADVNGDRLSDFSVLLDDPVALNQWAFIL